MKKLTVEVPEDLYRYLDFLEKRRMIKSKAQAVKTALKFYKMLAVHDWLPNLYRMGGSRVLLMEAGALLDIFHTLRNEEIYMVARMSAFKKKALNPLLSKADLTNPENWGIVLKELEIMGWGKFTRVNREIKVESCPIPTPYLLGLLETLFKTRFKEHKTRIPEVTILVAEDGEERPFLV
ncbi:TPA: hypothetical protein EYP26_00930 [Candidatus Bathyarchaeota archaeon]|nr:hypothetical protein [Candidatus Bathyarchaeota archaeon]